MLPLVLLPSAQMSASEVPGADTDCMLWGMLANGLSSNSVLCKLSLAYCHVSSAGVGYLAAALEHNPPGRSAVPGPVR